MRRRRIFRLICIFKGHSVKCHTGKIYCTRCHCNLEKHRLLCRTCGSGCYVSHPTKEFVWLCKGCGYEYSEYWVLEYGCGGLHARG